MSDPGPGDIGQGDRQPSPEAVRAQLARILASDEFVASDRLKDFLRFVVEEALGGRAERLKAYTIALKVLGRDAGFDAQNDPIVRMEAGKLRRRLEHYYLAAGRDDPIRIDIPKGGYAPRFVLPHDVEAAQAAGAVRQPHSFGHLSRRALWGLGGVLAAALILATTIWLRSETPLPEAAAGPATQARGPAIIVLPFESLSGVEAEETFAGGLTEELIYNLMRFGELRLYSVYGSFLEKPTADPIELGKRLDVGYVVKGSVRRGPDQIRLIVHLIEARTGQHLWTESYDRPLTPESVLAVQQQLAADLATELAQPYGIVHEISADLFRHQRPETLFAYDCVLRAFAYRRTLGPKLYSSQRACLEEAVRRDPGYADAWAMLAFAQLDEYRFDYGPRAGDASMLDTALSTARRAVELDADGVRGFLALSSILFYRREFAEADEANGRLMLLNPANPEVLAQVGWRTAFARDWDAGIDLLEQAIARSIKAPEWYHLIMAFHLYRLAEYQTALTEVEVIAGSDWFWGPIMLAAVQGQLGNQDEARRALDRAKDLNQGFFRDPRSAMRLHNLPEELIEQVLDGLRKAGLEVHAA